ncbi:hypothetical protein XENTR_v10011617 [Xenopus tropicalis]|nr:hypothetical protein XENTR_v10011617 [Xenopus tropicalis]
MIGLLIFIVFLQEAGCPDPFSANCRGKEERTVRWLPDSRFDNVIQKTISEGGNSNILFLLMTECTEILELQVQDLLFRMLGPGVFSGHPENPCSEVSLQHAGQSV